MKIYLCAALTCGLAGCAEKTDGEFRIELVSAMHDSIDADLANLVTAARNLQAAAPIRAWAMAPAAVSEMRDAWRRSRVAFEHVEGAIAPVFVDLEPKIDGRYDTYLAELEPGGDHDAFDGSGVIGMHAIERILYVPEMRREVLEFERTLPGYRAAAYPATDIEAIAFKTQLVQRLVEDATSLHAQWTPAAIDLAAAYEGLIGLMTEQQDKINLAATGKDESRYANVTLFDLRNNLEGTQKIYELFREWIRSKPTGPRTDDAIVRQLHAIEAAYAAAGDGDALPPAPADWVPDHPTDANLATPFGALWQAVHEHVDPGTSGSVVVEMNHVAALLGFPELGEP